MQISEDIIAEASTAEVAIELVPDSMISEHSINESLMEEAGANVCSSSANQLLRLIAPQVHAAASNSEKKSEEAEWLNHTKTVTIDENPPASEETQRLILKFN